MTEKTKSKKNFPFESLLSMRAEHAELVNLRRKEGLSNALFLHAKDFLERGIRTGTILDDISDRQAAQSLLDFWDNVLAKSSLNYIDPNLSEFDINLAPDLEDEDCPYIGLAPFSEESSNLFYGREDFTSKLATLLDNQALMAIVGPSGSGKSSAVTGGLIPKLKKSRTDSIIEFIQLVPGSDPNRSIANAITKSENVDEIVNRIETDNSTIFTILSKTRYSEVYVVIDQFEEVFTLCLDKEKRQAFFDNLVFLISQHNKFIKIILTMRTDFESRVLAYDPLGSIFIEHTIRILPLSAPELRDAIEKPAEQVGLKFASGVIDALVQDIVGEPAALPMLQFTLLKLWESRIHNLVTWEAYQKLGGGRLALSKSADQLYKNLLPEDQITAKRILLRMARPTEGLEITSNRIRKESLYVTGEASDRISRVLAKLILGNLIRESSHRQKSNTQLEIAHEALIRNWPRLVGWLEEEKVEMRRRIRLTYAAEQWQVSQESDDHLWRGDQLKEGLNFKDINKLELLFLTRSKKVEAEEKERELRQLNRLAKEAKERESERVARQKAETHAYNLKFRVWVLTAFAVLITILSFTSIFFLQNITFEAQRMQNLAEIIDSFNNNETNFSSKVAADSVKFEQNQRLLLLSTALLSQDSPPTKTEVELSALMAIQAIKFNQTTLNQIEPKIFENQLARLADELDQPIWNHFSWIYYQQEDERSLEKQNNNILFEEVCAELTRNFTWEEWQKYLSAFPYELTCDNHQIHPSVPIEMRPES